MTGSGAARVHPEYKLYCLDEAGRILHRHEYLAADDEAALRAAEARDHAEFGCELWTERRLLARLPRKA